MEILFATHYPDYVDVERWVATLEDALPGVRVRVWPELPNPEKIALVIGDFAPVGVYASLPNLKCIMYIGAGVDAMFRDPSFPRHIPLVRSDDSAITFQVAQYIALHVLDHHRHGRAYRAQQVEGIWRPIRTHDTRKLSVGLLGFGRIGKKTATVLRHLEFQVASWSRSAASKSPGVMHRTGREGLFETVRTSDYVVCTLPLTPETQGIIDRDVIAQMRKGAVLINVGRGRLVVEDDLLRALESGHVGGAILDVFKEEPLPRDHAFWTHPAVTVTPHVANFWVDGSMAEIVSLWHSIKADKPLRHVVDPDKGY